MKYPNSKNMFIQTKYITGSTLHHLHPPNSWSHTDIIMQERTVMRILVEGDSSLKSGVGVKISFLANIIKPYVCMNTLLRPSLVLERGPSK